MSKVKGTRGERELLYLFYETKKWGICRAAGSGSIPIPNPDLIAGKKGRILAIECKVLKSNIKYFKPNEIEQLIEFSKKFGAEPWIAIKFNRKEWHFLQPKNLIKTKNGIYSISKDLALKKGLKFDQVIK